jgi:hypothetical protein
LWNELVVKPPWDINLLLQFESFDSFQESRLINFFHKINVRGRRIFGMEKEPPEERQSSIFARSSKRASQPELEGAAS